MNWHYIVLIGAVLILFISMGKTPSFIAPPGYVPPDEFKDNIRAKIEDPGGFGVSQPFSTNNPGGYGGVGGGTFQGTTNNNAPNFGTSYGIGTMGQQPSYDATNNNADTTIAPSQNRVFPNQQRPNTPAVKGPAPFQNLPTDQNNSPQGYVPSSNNYRFVSNAAVETADGRPVQFSGSTVYTLNNQGQKVVMPNGKYELSNGLQITVRRGKNIFPPGGNEFN